MCFKRLPWLCGDRRWNKAREEVGRKTGVIAVVCLRENSGFIRLLIVKWEEWTDTKCTLKLE